MRRLLLWSSVAGFTACLLQPTLATITPDYSYVDGCQSVIIQGHHLGTAATAKIGDAPFVSLQAAENDPDVPEHAQDVGFKYYGVVPASPTGESGWFDVVLTVDGEDLTIPSGWYYRTCPGEFVVDAYDVPADATVGTEISFQGCSLNDSVQLDFMDYTGTVVASAPLVSDCSTAFVHAVVPTLPAGDYTMALTNGNSSFYLQTCFSESGDTGVTCIQDTVSVAAR